MVAKVTGEYAIDALAHADGSDEPGRGAARSIRGDFATLIGENIVHGSDSPASAARELGLFFPEG